MPHVNHQRGATARRVYRWEGASHTRLLWAKHRSNRKQKRWAQRKFRAQERQGKEPRRVRWY